MPAADIDETRNGAARREKRRGSEKGERIGKPSTTGPRRPRGGEFRDLESGKRVGLKGEGERLDHDCTARRGIMDTIIRERLEVLVIFLLPRLTRTLVHIAARMIFTQANALAQTEHKLPPERVDRVLRDSSGSRSSLILALREDRRR